MDKESFKKYIEKKFTYNTLPYLMNFIRIPNLSPDFDNNWKTNGLLEKAANFIISYIQSLKLKNADVNLIQDKGYTPLIFVEIPSTRKNDLRTILFYAHFDKQPHGVGWDEDKGPTKPVIENNHLYGRGTADDGYAIFSILTAIKTCYSSAYPSGFMLCHLQLSRTMSSRSSSAFQPSSANALDGSL